MERSKVSLKAAEPQQGGWVLQREGSKPSWGELSSGDCGEKLVEEGLQAQSDEPCLRSARKPFLQPNKLEMFQTFSVDLSDSPNSTN